MGDGDRRASLESVISTAIDTALKEVHTILPGQIISFNPVEQIADIQPQLKRNVDGKLINLPVLSNVPIRFMKSGDFTITFPLKENDEVAVYIIERSIDNWFEDGGLQSPNDYRKFDLSDAYAVPILYSQAQKIENFDPDNMVIKSTNGNSEIILKTNGNIIVNAIDATVNATSVNLGGSGGFGLITMESVDPFTGNPHIDGSTIVKAIKS